MNRRDFFKNMAGAGIAAMFLPSVQWIGEESKFATSLTEGAGLRFFDDWVLNVTHDPCIVSIGGGFSMSLPGRKSAELIVNFPSDEWEAYRKAFNQCELVECKLRRNGEDRYMVGNFYLTTIFHNNDRCGAELVLSGVLSISAD